MCQTFLNNTVLVFKPKISWLTVVGRTKPILYTYSTFIKKEVQLQYQNNFVLQEILDVLKKEDKLGDRNAPRGSFICNCLLSLIIMLLTALLSVIACCH